MQRESIRIRAGVLAALAAATLGLLGCSGASANPAVSHKDAGATGYGGASSGGMLGIQGGSSGAAGDDAGDVADADAVGSDATIAPTDAPAGDVSGEGGVASGDSGGGGGSSCQRPPGGPPCDPGVVSCGGTSCSTATSFCCVGGAEGGTADICSPFNGASCPNYATAVACDESSDCSGSVCCEENVGIGVQGPTQCMASCPSGWFQVCKSDTECRGERDAGGQCVRQTCTDPGGLFGGGSSVTVEACAVPATLGNLNNAGALMGCVAQ